MKKRHDMLHFEHGRKTQQYPIDSRCKDCFLFQVVEEMKKEISALKAEIVELKKRAGAISEASKRLK